MLIFRALFAVVIALPYMSAAGAIVFQDNFDGNQPGLSAIPIGGWTVSDGTVDIHGPGFFDLIPGNGLYVDLEGTRNAGVLSRTFSLTTGATYTVTYTLAGGRLSFDPINIVDVQFGTATASHRLLADDGPTTYSLTFQPSATGAASLAFSNQGVDDWGAFLLDVTVTGPATEPPKPPKPTYSFADVIRDSVVRQVIQENGRQWEIGSFTPNFQLTLIEAAKLGGFESFNWYQVIRQDTRHSRCLSDKSQCTDIDRDGSGQIYSIPFEDPPLSGYFGSANDSYGNDSKHGYYDDEALSLAGFGAVPPIMTGTTFTSRDSPCRTVPGDQILFSTFLGGRDPFGNLQVFIGGNTSFRWRYSQISPGSCGLIDNLAAFIPDDLLPSEGIFDQLEFISANNLFDDERTLLTSHGIEVLQLDVPRGVSEPSTHGLLALGMASVWLIRRRQQQCRQGIRP
ncbi:DUF642 domain-containing protein [Candidatus Accumulibacter phosphatis]|uniref:DUF642 domain-containing protein n=1 Tax=Candidatus Accumulibacter phosphatis TaxID=327160 RepID=A0A5S4EPR9_9PROT|nr:DUF642 domain-containing protein [Candidatus Accumulibacter phosphatis]TMQ77451.1 hypothetical protein ACCUM_3062 [Candidatus Accumulibacter phosphatis]